MTRASAAAGAAVAVLVCCALGAAAAQDDSSSCPPLSYANASALLAGPRAANALALPMCARALLEAHGVVSAGGGKRRTQQH